MFYTTFRIGFMAAIAAGLQLLAQVLLCNLQLSCSIQAAI